MFNYIFGKCELCIGNFVKKNTSYKGAIFDVHLIYLFIYLDERHMMLVIAGKEIYVITQTPLTAICFDCFEKQLSYKVSGFLILSVCNG